MPAAIPTSARWAPVRIAITHWATDPTTVANGNTQDGVVLATGDRFVVVGERADAGVYTVGPSSSARADDANHAAEFANGRVVRVLEGSADNRGLWAVRVPDPFVLGTTPLIIGFLIAEALDLEGLTFSNAPAVPISVASATTIYYGTSELPTLTEGQAKSELLSRTQTSPAGTFVCVGLGRKYLAVPSSMSAPVAIRDQATGFAVPLAGADDGYTQTTSGLTHRSLSIDGVGYRLYRSANVINSDITLEIA